jgi:hypothetical protein
MATLSDLVYNNDYKKLGPARAAIGQGLMMGWGDEAEAWLRSKLKDDEYEPELKQIQSEYGKYSAENPNTSTALEFAGGALPAVFAPEVSLPKILGSATEGAYKRGMGLGAVQGAIAGAGNAKEGERSMGAQYGAASGATLGAAVPALMRGTGAGLGWLRERLTPTESVIENRALGKVAEAIKEDELTPSNINRTVMYDQARGIPSTIANASPSLVHLADTMAQRSGPSGRLIDQVLNEQKAGARERTYQRARDEISTGNYYEDAQRLSDDLRAKAQPLYDAAYAHGEVNDPVINELLTSPRFQSFFRKGQQIAKDKQIVARANGEDPSQYELRNIYSADPVTGETVVSTLPDVRTLDYIKKGIDAQITSLFKAGKSTDASNLKDMREVLLNKLDETVPAYKTARREYAGDKEVINAMEAGYKDFPHLNHEEVESMIGNMSQAEKDAFKTGVVRNIHSIVMDPSNNINAAARVIRSPETQKSLNALFDSPAQFDLFKAAMLREAQLYDQANQIMGGAQTGRRIQARERFEQGPDVGGVVSDAIRSGWKDSLMNLTTDVINSSQMSDKVAHKVSQLLMSKDPHEVAAAVRALENYNAKAKVGAKALNRAELAGVGGIGAAQYSPPTYESDARPSIYDALEKRNSTESEQPTRPSIYDALEARRNKNIPGGKMGATE